jgi:hypothetical protein
MMGMGILTTGNGSQVIGHPKSSKSLIKFGGGKNMGEHQSSNKRSGCNTLKAETISHC